MSHFVIFQTKSRLSLGSALLGVLYDMIVFSDWPILDSCLQVFYT